MRIIDFSDGFTSETEPSTIAYSVTSLARFASDAAFVADKGSDAVNGDTYYNTTSHAHRLYSNDAWISHARTTGNVFESEVGMLPIATPSNPASGLSYFVRENNGFSEFVVIDSNGLEVVLGGDNRPIVRNVTGSTIDKGVPVYVSGQTGIVAEVTPARANSLGTLPAIGLTTQAIPNNGFGPIVKLGVLDSINTSGFTAGDVLYVSSITAGLLTATKPTHPNLAQVVGKVLVSGVGNGSISVNISQNPDGDESGTLKNIFEIGDGTAGEKELVFDGSVDQSFVSEATQSQRIKLPVARPSGTGKTIVVSSVVNGDIDTEWGDVAATFNVATKSSAYTLTNSDDLLFVTGTTTITTHASATATQKNYTIINTGSNTVTVDGNASETINGATTVTIPPGGWMRIIPNGTNWVISSRSHPNRAQTKILTGNITTNIAIPDLAFSNLTIGRVYRITGVVSLTLVANDYGGVVFGCGGTVGQVGAESSSTTDIFRMNVAVVFTAAATTFSATASSIGAGSSVDGNGLRTATFLTLEELNNTQETTDF